MRLAVLVVALLVFTVPSLVVFSAHGGFAGAFGLAFSGGWASQVFADLVVACTLFCFWMVPEGRRVGVPAWPYVLLVLAAGSIGALAFLVHRELVRVRAKVAA